MCEIRLEFAPPIGPPPSPSPQPMASPGETPPPRAPGGQADQEPVQGTPAGAAVAHVLADLLAAASLSPTEPEAAASVLPTSTSRTQEFAVHRAAARGALQCHAVPRSLGLTLLWRGAHTFLCQSVRLPRAEKLQRRVTKTWPRQQRQSCSSCRCRASPPQQLWAWSSRRTWRRMRARRLTRSARSVMRPLSPACRRRASSTGARCWFRRQ